jgi:cell pole-organizing protein PopZ
MTEPGQPLDDIMASIRRAVENSPLLPDPAAERADEAMPEPLPAPPALPLTPELTVDQLVRSLLEPHLKAWLEANLPEMVERLTRAEIARLTGH